jgi:hypothetical protein
MISWLAASFLVVGFVILYKLFALVEKSRRVFTITLQSLGIIQNSGLSDEEKERSLQKNATRMFSLFFQLLFGGVVALVIPIVLVWLAGRAGLLSFDSVMTVTFSPTFLVGSCALVICILCLMPRSQEHSTTKYTKLERISHQLAFNTSLTQVAISRLEDKLLAKKLFSIRNDNPVFITSMPRAGTTLLLECLARHPEFASHCYRDMPFLLIPWLWNRFTGIFRKGSDSHERAHGDGMLINFDSPEALEELIWKTFWHEKYQEDRILLWEEETHEEFENFFLNHIRKIIYLRKEQEVGVVRYVSKNNLNISRIPLLHKLFTDPIILVPFRDPLQHSASLLAQHHNFLNIHKKDPFVSEYMKAIGHFDFGENLRPVDFNGWLNKRESQDPLSLAFWLEYWNACYDWLLNECSELVHFIHYEALCAHPESSFLALAKTLEITDTATLLEISKDVRPVRSREVDANEVPDAILQKSLILYAELQRRSSV